MSTQHHKQCAGRLLTLTLGMLVISMVLALAARPALAQCKGTTFVVGGNTYRIDEFDQKDQEGDVTLTSYGAKSTKPTINTVRYHGIVFEVETIGRKAFNTTRGRKVTSITLGKEVDRVQAKAFYGTKRLKVINMSASDIVDLEKVKGAWTIDEIDAAKQAFTGAGASKLTIRCGKKSKAYQKVYLKALVSRGLRKDAAMAK